MAKSSTVKVDLNVDELKKRAAKLATTQLTIEEVFTPDFMARHTAFATFDALWAGSEFVGRGDEAAALVETPEWSAYIGRVTPFPDWRAMKSAASNEWARREF